MFAPLPEDAARFYAYELMKTLDREKRLDFEVSGRAPDPDLSVGRLFEPHGGRMFGICVCRGADGTDIVLKAFSGQFNGRWVIPGWVPPCLDVTKYRALTDRDGLHIGEMTEKIRGGRICKEELQELKKERASLSRASLENICALYRFHCACGSRETFADFYKGFVPSGTGDCCAPKLLSYAFMRGLRPYSLTEFYYGSGGRANTRRHGCFYPPCDEKCRIVLPRILGLEIVYRDRHIIVVNKPSGLLSVPGKTPDLQDCIVNRVKRLFPECIAQPSVHRLDMDTSGLMVLAFTAEAHRNLSRQFMEGQVQKEYTALLDGRLRRRDRIAGKGRIELSFRLDTENRPHQIYDPVYGKRGVSDWEVVKEEWHSRGGRIKRTRIRFVPHTGRTHQLRLHASHPLGLGVPIAGDRLYGVSAGERLMLHSRRLRFRHPASGALLDFTAEAEF